MIAIEFSGIPPKDKLLRAGYEAEKQLAFYLRRAFQEPAYDFRVFNGLRIERHGEIAQIDHLVLHRFGFALVESKSIADSININQHGEFERRFGSRTRGMRSPIAQVKLQAELLQNLLNDQKERLRRKVGIGPLKRQSHFSDHRFMVIAAISDKARITCDGARPPELMKAEAVVKAIQDRVDYQHSLAGVKGMASTFTDRKKSREWDDNYLPPFTDDEIDAISAFLQREHKPLAGSANGPAEAKMRPSPSASPPSRARHAAAEAKPTAATRKLPERNLRRWTPDEEDRLREAFATGRTPSELAADFGRTAKALRLRAVKLELIQEPGDWR